MFFAIVGKEIRDQILNVRFHVSLILTFVLLAPGTAILISEYGRQARDMNPYISEGFYTWGFSWYWLNRHIPALQVLSTGLGSNISLQTSNTFYQGPIFTNNLRFINNPLQFLFSDLDFAFVINVVGSLLAIVFTYDAISGEREARTLRLILANSVPRALILAGKYVGCFLSFILSLLPGLTGLAIVLLIHPDANLSGTHWLSVLYILLISSLYLAVFFMLGIFVSTVTRHPRTSLAALLVAWVMLVLIIPNFSPWLAARLSPVRSIYEVEEEIRVASENSDARASRALNEYTKTLPERAKWTDEQEAKFQDLLRKARQEYIPGRVESVLKSRQAFMNELQRQAEVSRWLSLLSPSASFVLMVSDVANTGMEGERNFRRIVFNYKRTYARFVVEELAKGNDNVVRRIDKTKVPAFAYRELSLEQVFVKHLSSFLALLIYATLLMIIPQIAFNRMQV